MSDDKHVPSSKALSVAPDPFPSPTWCPVHERTAYICATCLNNDCEGGCNGGVTGICEVTKK